MSKRMVLIPNPLTRNGIIRGFERLSHGHDGFQVL